MYMRSSTCSVQSQKGWGALAKDPELTFELSFDPSASTKSGRATLARWIRAGYCDSPNGSLCKEWTMLMWAAQASYLFEIDLRGPILIKPYHKDQERPYDGMVEKIDPILRIVAAGATPAPAVLGKLVSIERTHTVNMMVDENRCQAARLTVITDDVNVHGQFCTHAKKIGHSIVRALGHPLTEVQKQYALGLLDTGRLAFTVHCKYVVIDKVQSATTQYIQRKE